MIPDQASNAVVAWIGIVLQLSGSLLCLGLGLILRQSSGGRRWMTCWVSAFAALSVAIAALLVRYYVLPLLPIGSLQQYQTLVVSALYAVYLAAKLLFLLSLLTGTWLFATRRQLPKRFLAGALTIIGVVALIVFLVPTDLDPLMAGQSVIAIPVFLACATLLFRQAPERRTRGSRLLATVCALLAALWLLYFPGFLRLGPSLPPVMGGFLQAVTFHNSYIDLLFEFLLGFGMIMAVLDDVYREAEEARAVRLREVAASEARLSQIINAASEGIVLLDSARRIVHCNPAALGILACTEPELLGVSFDRFLTTDAPDELWLDAGDGGSRIGTTGGHALLGRRCDGREFPMELSLSAIGDGIPAGFVLIVRDRTERVRLEAERDRNRDQFAQTVRLETIGRMVSGVAHELNNPLTAIMAFAQDLLSQSQSLTDTEALTTIVQQSQRCRSIVLDLLTFSRSNRDDREPAAPISIVRRVQPAIQRQADARGVHLDMKVSPDLPHIEVSPAGMEQVLTNLLVNAIQAVKPGGRVTLRAGVTGDRLSLIVEDDGPGIAAESMPRIFEPFFTTKGHGEGTGLGLSVSHSIVEQLGGTLTGENRNPGERGARFTVRLPYVDRRAAARRVPEASPVDPPPQVSGDRAPRRVLVVDDEAPIRVAIRRFLERRGWTVAEAGNGLEALERLGLDEGGRFQADSYDVIITDLKMPGVTGVELYNRLAAVSPESVAKLVMISGDTASPEVAQFVGRLRQPLIQKPFDMRALADLLDQIVPAAPAAPPAR
ncbi:MAG TPA: ATP-binding protein [Gemmatimonadales bacterium]|nr:ATP-binding protein [Gemmatimonadales bacterium]